MTVPVPGSLTYSYDEDGITTVFAYPVRFFEPQELEVVREVGGVHTTLTYNVDYTVSGAGSPSGGSITRAAATDGGKIIITRNTAWKQIVDLTDNGRNPAESVEQQLDRLTMAGQDARASVDTLLLKTGELDEAVTRAEAAKDDAEGAKDDAEAARDAAMSAVPNAFPVDRAALKALDTSSITSAYLKEAGREGQFLWHTGDYSAELAADTQEGIYIKADAVAATAGAWVRSCDLRKIELAWFGIIPDSTDGAVLAANTAALNSALDLLNSNDGGELIFPPHRFYFGTRIAKSLSGRVAITLSGAGQGVSQAVTTDVSGAFQFTYENEPWWAKDPNGNSMTVRDLTIATTQPNLGIGLQIDGGIIEGIPPAPTNVTRVTFRGDDRNSGFLYNLHYLDCGETNTTDCAFYGQVWNTTSTFIFIESSDADPYTSTRDPTLHFVSGCRGYYGGKAIWATDNVEGIHVSNSAFVAVDRGVYWLASVNELQLSIHGCHIAANILCLDLYNIAASQIIGNLFSVAPGGVVIRISSGVNNTISGNCLAGGDVGIHLTNSGYPHDPAHYAWGPGCTIGGNSFFGMTTGILGEADFGSINVADSNNFSSTVAVPVAVLGPNCNLPERSGSWTPSLTFGGAAVGLTYGAVRVGEYIRRGKTVTATCSILLTDKGSSSGAAVISGLPVAAKNVVGTLWSGSVGYYGGMSGLTAAPIIHLEPGSTSIKIFASGAAAVPATEANFTNSSEIYISLSYEVD